MPEVLLLDEPSEGLDPRGRVEMRNLLRGLARERNTTIFLSSHLLTEVEQLCSHVGFLHHGRLLASGPTTELLDQGTTSLEIMASPPGAARRILEGLPEVQNLSTDGDALLVSCAAASVPEINQKLVEAGVRVAQLNPRRQNLEEFYLALTEERDA
jgi:ABC-type multidrug transport system ATPase subunit